MPTPDPTATVTQLLAASQLAPTPDEVATMIADYPQLRRGADALYLSELDDLEPAVKFNPLDPY